MYPNDVKKRFWEKVELGTGCWEWKACCEKKTGYGVFFNSSKKIHSHRMSWLLCYGEIPKGLCVLHHCDNRKCIRADHLFLGTKGDNNRDCFKKGRSQIHHWTVLDSEKVKNIRIRWAEGRSFRQIATEFGIKYQHTVKVCKKMIWKHVT